MRKLLLLMLLLPGLVFAGPWFGYYHVHNHEIVEVVDHTNMLLVQTGNPEQDLDYLLALHPAAPFVLEFTAVDIAITYNKVYSYNHERTVAILDGVERLVAGHKQRLYALAIADEMETNHQSLQALAAVVYQIKRRPLLADVPLWVNFHNIFPAYSRTEFVIPEGITYVSLTPDYGIDCGSALCEEDRYRFFLDAVAAHNAVRPGSPAKVIVIGDNWSRLQNVASADRIHLQKSEALYARVLRLAAERQIEVVGQAVFSYGFPDFGVRRSSVMRERWREIGLRLIGARSAVGVSPMPSDFPLPSNRPPVLLDHNGCEVLP